MKKVFFYYNPVSGNKILQSKLDLIIKRFQEKKQVIIPIRSRPHDDLTKIFRTYNFSEYDKVLVGGGDGTINKVASAMVESGIPLPLAMLPFGTANDYSRCFNIPRNLDKMLDIAVKHHTKHIDIGKANDRFFVNVFAVGMIASLSQRVNKNAKGVLGPLAYYAQGVSELPKLKPINVKIKSKEKSFEGKMLFAVVMNGRSAGGFAKIAPSSSLEDGKLDVIVFKEMPFYDMPGVFFQVLSGAHYKNPNVISWQTTSLSIEAVSTRSKIVTDVDGEAAGYLPVEISLLPKELKVITDSSC